MNTSLLLPVISSTEASVTVYKQKERNENFSVSKKYLTYFQ